MLLFLQSSVALAGTPQADSSSYRRHVRYIRKEHRKLTRHLDRLCRNVYSDTLIGQDYVQIRQSYHAAVKHISYVANPKTHAPLSKKYRESESHKGVIERTYAQLDRASQSGSSALLARGFVSEARKLQKQTFYPAGKYTYFKKFHAPSFLNNIQAGKVEALKQVQRFTTPVAKAKAQASAVPSSLHVPAVPKVNLPGHLQTNAHVNQTFASGNPAGGPSKQQKLQEAISGKSFTLPDSTVKDTILFKPNPYRLMPFSARIKTGGNFEAGSLVSGGKRFVYAINFTYLLSPRVKPVLAVGYEHSFTLSRGNAYAESIAFTIRAGAELHVYKAFSLFGNLEQNIPAHPALKQEQSGRNTDFVVGLTNDTGKKRRLKIWAGINLHQLTQRHASPFVFRVGL